jgi:hypothetical protein
MDDKEYMRAEKARLEERRRNEIALERAARENKHAREAERASNRKKGLDGELKSWT